MSRFLRCLVLLTALALPGRSEIKQVLLEQPHFRLVQLDTGSFAVQTENLTFQKGKTTVRVLSTIHVATRDYYAAIQGALARQPFDPVLYEENHPHGAEVELAKACGADLALREGVNAQIVSARLLDLAYQWNELDLSGPRFVFADIEARTVAETVAFTRAWAAEERDLFRKRSAEAAAMKEADLDQAILKDYRDLLRKTIPDRDAFARICIAQEPTPEEAESDLARERHCFSLLLKHIDPGKDQAIALLFGAVHTQSFKKMLLAEGFEQTSADWSTAYSYDPPQAGGAKAGAEPKPGESKQAREVTAGAKGSVD